jgi:hypothetical protein
MGIRAVHDVVMNRHTSAQAETHTPVVQVVASHFRTIKEECGRYVSEDQSGNTIFNIMLKVFRKLPRLGRQTSVPVMFPI